MISNTSDMTPAVKPAKRFPADSATAVYRQRFTPAAANLLFLSWGEFDVPGGGASGETTILGQEILLFMWKGSAEVHVADAVYDLQPYDTLYVTRDLPFRIVNPGPDRAVVLQASAPAEKRHPVFHSRFTEFSKCEERIRHLKGKDVYMMFDVSEGADKLIAGYTFFQPFQRSWPPHNHTDQEEAYFFIKGHGSMEVYESPETLSFVHNVQEGDVVTIPMLNYHPVFSQEDPLEFIWCIAGERYWVGDKNKAFMNGTGPAITT